MAAVQRIFFPSGRRWVCCPLPHVKCALGRQKHQSCKPSCGLADDEIAKMLQDSFSASELDMQARALREEQVEADRLLLAIDSALSTDKHLLSDAEQATIAGKIEELKQIKLGTDHQTIQRRHYRVGRCH